MHQTNPTFKSMPKGVCFPDFTVVLFLAHDLIHRPYPHVHTPDPSNTPSKLLRAIHIALVLLEIANSNTNIAGILNIAIFKNRIAIIRRC
jgi:hypothetical protein